MNNGEQYIRHAKNSFVQQELHEIITTLTSRYFIMCRLTLLRRYWKMECHAFPVKHRA